MNIVEALLMEALRSRFRQEEFEDSQYVDYEDLSESRGDNEKD